MTRKPLTGVPAVLEILNNLAPAERDKLLANLTARDPKLGAQLRDQLFTFDDLATLPPDMLQTLIKQVDEPLLVLSLRSAPEALRQALLANMTKRQAASFNDSLENGAPRPLSEVRRAQAEVMDICRRLETLGLVLLKRP